MRFSGRLAESMLAYYAAILERLAALTQELARAINEADKKLAEEISADRTT
jgi:NTP pyrophosphatase (non-canonical NTP hydrolase)